MRRWSMLTLTVALVAFGAATQPQPCAGQIVWQIGKFDQSSYEFSHRTPFNDPDYNPVYRIGTSTAQDWPAMQPGSENKAAGERPHPYTIRFSLQARPRGAYRLVVSALLYHSRHPYLHVSINGKSGNYYFHPKLNYYPGDPAFWSPIYASDEITITLPALSLAKGENELVLTALDDPREGPGDSWLAYDALRLVHDVSSPRAMPVMNVTPTIYYVRQDAGLAEIVRVAVSLVRKVRHGEINLSMNGKEFSAPLSAQPDFGEQRFEFAVPDFSPSAPAQLTLRLNGKTYRKEISLVAERKWTLDLAPHEHLDVGYTDYRGKVAELHNRNVDKLVRLIARHPEMRWNLDGSWIVRNYLATRTPRAKQAFLSLARAGKIAVPAQFANLLTGFASLEELIRSTFYSLSLHRKESLPFDYANITDVPSYTWSYPSILHALGIRYFAAASNNDRAPILLWGRWNTESPFWWEGPDGSKVLMSYSRQYSQLAFICGLPGKIAACRQSLPTFLQAYDRPSYKPDVALLYGFQVENSDLVPGEVSFVRHWNRLYAYPKIVFATFPEYLRYIDSHYGRSLPVVTGDGGPYWEDGVATDARYAALDRLDQQRALSAEKLATLAGYFEKTVAGPRAQIRRMWRDQILYAEHTFTSWGGYSRPNSDETVRQAFTKDQYAVDAHLEINSIVEQSFSQLSTRIHLAAPAIVVFNPLSWTRSGLVEADLDDHTVLREVPRMNPIPVEVLRRGAGYRHVRFMAENVPTMGYQCYAIRPESAAGMNGASDKTVLPLTNTIENRYYRIQFDPASGAIRSIYDKQLQQELVSQAGPYRMDQYLYVSGGEGSQIVVLAKARPLARLNVTPSGPGHVTRVEKTPYGEILSYQTSGRDAPSLRTNVILFDNEKKIEFVNRFEKQPEMHKEAIYFAFPFALKHPRFRYEIQNGWVDPARDILKGGSLEWFTVRHWVRVEGTKFAASVIPLNAPLVTLGDINRGTWPEQFVPKSATIFSYVINNYWHTNYYRVQSGSYTFRYVLTSGPKLPAEALARLGREAMTPLEHAQLISNDKYGNPPEPLRPAPTSFLTLDSPNVVVEDWKRAEDGNGTILRPLEVGGESARARLTFPFFSLQQAWQTNAQEENQTELAVEGHSIEVPVKPHEIVTLRLIAWQVRRAVANKAEPGVGPRAERRRLPKSSRWAAGWWLPRLGYRHCILERADPLSSPCSRSTRQNWWSSLAGAIQTGKSAR